MSLTHEQVGIVNAPPETRMLVTAGPGTGKTHVVIARLAHLIEHHGLSPGQDLLVLSFSRAAVGEIAARAGADGSDTGFVRARTFDSYATSLLSEYDPDGAWNSASYDDRIVHATALLRKNEEAADAVAQYCHVIVDEIQDLVSVRADFVTAILDRIAGGFTLLGDPAQGIYDFQLPEAARTEGARIFYRRLRERYGKDLIERGLTENFRAQTPGARTALWAGAPLNGNAPDYATIKDRLETDIVGLRTLGSVELAAKRLCVAGQRTAVLLRDNGRTMMLSRDLRALGVPHRCQRRATDRVVPAWIAYLFSGISVRTAGRAMILDRVRDRFPHGEPDPDFVWRMLRRMDSRNRDTVDLGVLEERIRTGYLPDELNEISNDDLVLSTVHRAKGLEFDRVAVTDPRRGNDDKNMGEESRILYVALTRPKRDLLHLDVKDYKGLRKYSKGDRWFRRYEKWKVVSVEVRPEDIHREDPAGALRLKDVDPKETQNYLATHLTTPVPVSLRRLSSRSADDRHAFYAVEHDGRQVGVTSEHFADALYGILRSAHGPNVRWPDVIDDLYTDGIETAAGSGATAQRHGLGSVGVWLSVRVAGMGNLRFSRAA